MALNDKLTTEWSDDAPPPEPTDDDLPAAAPIDVPLPEPLERLDLAAPTPAPRPESVAVPQQPLPPPLPSMPSRPASRRASTVGMARRKRLNAALPAMPSRQAPLPAAPDQDESEPPPDPSPEQMPGTVTSASGRTRRSYAAWLNQRQRPGSAIEAVEPPMPGNQPRENAPQPPRPQMGGEDTGNALREMNASLKAQTELLRQILNKIGSVVS